MAQLVVRNLEENVKALLQRRASRHGCSMEEDFQGRILHFDAVDAKAAALIAARRRKTGPAVEIRDTQIAGIVTARRATLATRNLRNFSDIDADVIDPWAG